MAWSAALTGYWLYWHFVLISSRNSLFVHSVSDSSGLCWYWTHHDREASQPGEWHRVVVEKPEHAVLGHWFHQRSDAWGGWKEVPCDCHQGETYIVVAHVINTVWHQYGWKICLDFVSLCKTKQYKLIRCVTFAGPAWLVWAEKRQRQQGHNSIKHNVYRGSVSSFPASPLEVPQDGRQQAVWVYAWWDILCWMFVYFWCLVLGECWNDANYCYTKSHWLLSMNKAYCDFVWLILFFLAQRHMMVFRTWHVILSSR